MESIIIAVAGFLIYSYIGAVKQKMKGNPSRKLGEPWIPPVVPRRARGELRRTWPIPGLPRQLEPWEQNQGPEQPSIDPGKFQELSDSAGKEGEWGDEGRETLLSQGVEGYASSEIPSTPAKVTREAARRLAGTEPRESPAIQNAQDLPEAVITESELAKGVIWAEVLGRPRSLRPFHGPRT